MHPAYYFLIVFCILLSPFVYLTFKYRNPYRLICVFGKKGSGKSCYMCKLAQRYLRKGFTVYSNMWIPGTYKFDPAKDLGFYFIEENSLLLVDEASQIWSDRHWQSFKDEHNDYFRKQRKYKHVVYLFSQDFKLDKNIRNLCDRMYMMVNFFGWLSVAKEIKRYFMVVEPQGESEARIADTLKITPWLFTPFGAREFIFVPHWIKYFDTLEGRVDLPLRRFKFQEYPDYIKDKQRPKQFRSKAKNPSEEVNKSEA